MSLRTRVWLSFVVLAGLMVFLFKPYTSWDDGLVLQAMYLKNSVQVGSDSLQALRLFDGCRSFNTYP